MIKYFLFVVFNLSKIHNLKQFTTNITCIIYIRILSKIHNLKQFTTHFSQLFVCQEISVLGSLLLYVKGGFSLDDFSFFCCREGLGRMTQTYWSIR